LRPHRESASSYLSPAPRSTRDRFTANLDRHALQFLTAYIAGV
jgi:hypothetical protein